MVAVPIVLFFLNHQTFGLSTLVFLLGSSIGWTAMVVFRREWGQVSPYLLATLWAITRGLALVAGEPSVDDDVYRYLWDGAQLMTGGAPYASAPAEYFHTTLPPGLDWLADRLNYPQLATVYGPVWILFGALGWSLAPDSLLGWKVVLIVIEAVVALTARGWQRPPMAFAWLTCPLWYWEVFLQGHAEVLSIGLWLIGFVALSRGQGIRAGLLMALALGGRWSMVVPIVLALLLTRSQSGTRLRVLVGLGGGAVMVIAGLWGMGPIDGSGLRALGTGWTFNPIIWKWFPEQPSGVWAVGMGIILILHLKPWNYFIQDLEIWTSMMAVWLLASPVINPWYLLWLLPGSVMAKRLQWWMAWSAVIPITYLQAQWLGDLNRGGGLHAHPDLVWWIQFGTIAAVALKCRREQDNLESVVD